MTNITHFIEFHDKRTLMAESYFELVYLWNLPLAYVKALQVIFIGFLVWILSGLLLIFTGSYLTVTTTRKAGKDVFFAAFTEKIRKSFRHQNEETFNTILMGINRVLKTNTEEPTVLMMLVPQGAMPTAIELVLLLIHCILLANHLPADVEHINRVISDGALQTPHDQEWPFVHRIKMQLRVYGVAAVLNFENLSPQLVRTLQQLVPLVHAPSPESVLILVVDLKNRFTEYEQKNWAPNLIGRTFLQEYFGPYFNQMEQMEAIKRLGCRCVLINPEPELKSYINDLNSYMR